MRIAKKLTQSVPLTKGRIPKIGEGVAVGNHSVPPNTSPTGIVWSGTRYTSCCPSISIVGTKATMPGVRRKTPGFGWPGFHWKPVSVREKRCKLYRTACLLK